jgi:hypothetical protein
MFAVAIAFVAPDQLVFTGNAANDAIIINDDGAGAITGSATNGGGVLAPFPAFAGIRRVIINTNAGNDRVAYNFTNDIGGFHYISASLGGGKDSFKMNATADIDQPANSNLYVFAYGNAGDDTIALHQRGEVDGLEYLISDGGDGQDTLVTDVYLQAGSTGYLNAQAMGNMGDDTVSMLVRKQLAADPIFINAVASGGAGFDNITRTPWALNDATCEVVAVIP